MWNADRLLFLHQGGGWEIGKGGSIQAKQWSPKMCNRRDSGVCAVGPRAALVVRGGLQAMWVSVK